MLDLTTEFGQHVARRLQEERIIWLTTISPDNIPHPRAVLLIFNFILFDIYENMN